MVIELSDYTGLVHKIAYKYNGYNLEHDDLFQVGMIGLWKAQQEFKEGKGKLTTFAGIIIDNQIKMHIRDLNTAKRKGKTVSLDASIGADGAEWHEVNGDGRSCDKYNSVEISESLQQILPNLKPAQQKIIKCALDHDTDSQTEIARILNMSVKTIGSIFMAMRPKLSCLRGV